jgi:putative membrane fusion protein
MKRGTKVLLVIFLAVAVGLYLYIFAAPRIEGMSDVTSVLEYGDLPVLDKAEILIIRDETLFASKKSGAVTYEEPEGTKVRKGVRIMSVKGGSVGGAGGDAVSGGAAGESELSAAERVGGIAGDEVKMTSGFKANRTAVVSYYADGYEKKLSAETMGSVTFGDVASFPAGGESLVSESVNAGEPVYKLADNNEWYMMYWTGATGEAERYATGSAVTVSLGEQSVDAEVYDAVPEGDMLRVTLRSDMYYEDLMRVRRADAEIVFAEYKGLIADASSIVERDGVTGVRVKQRSGAYKWVPVKILKEAGGKCALAADVYYDEKGEQVNTVNYYDEVLTNPGDSANE